MIFGFLLSCYLKKKIGNRKARYSGGPPTGLLCCAARGKRGQSYRETADLGPVRGPGTLITHTLHSFFSAPAVLALQFMYLRSLERFHFHPNCLHKTDQRNSMLFTGQELSKLLVCLEITYTLS